MKQKLILSIFVLLCLLPAKAREYAVSGPEGGLAMKVALPEGFNPATDRCPMVLLMHGIFSSKDYNPMPSLAKALAQAGIASIRFDFDGHGKSEGRMQDMTVEKEIADALAIWEYAKSLPYVTQIGFLGHSQGGVIASMTAGRLAAAGGAVPAGVVLLAPGSVAGIHPLLGHHETRPRIPPHHPATGHLRHGRRIPRPCPAAPWNQGHHRPHVVQRTVP